AAGPAIIAELARRLGGIHQLDPAITRRADLALTPRARVLAHIDSYYQLWRSHHVEPSSLVESGFAWARDHVDRLSDQSVLEHGDFLLGSAGFVEYVTTSAALDAALQKAS